MLYLPRTTSLTGALWRFKIRTRALSVVTFVAMSVLILLAGYARCWSVTV
jgi:hypothetical protein